MILCWLSAVYTHLPLCYLSAHVRLQSGRLPAPPDVVYDALARATLDEALGLADNGHFQRIPDALLGQGVIDEIGALEDIVICAIEDGPGDGGDSGKVEY